MRVAGFELGTLGTRGDRTLHSTNRAYMDCAPKMRYVPRCFARLLLRADFQRRTLQKNEDLIRTCFTYVGKFSSLYFKFSCRATIAFAKK
jgi:hypothetical protein